MPIVDEVTVQSSADAREYRARRRIDRALFGDRRFMDHVATRVNRKMAQPSDWRITVRLTPTVRRALSLRRVDHITRRQILGDIKSRVEQELASRGTADVKLRIWVHEGGWSVMGAPYVPIPLLSPAYIHISSRRSR